MLSLGKIGSQDMHYNQPMEKVMAELSSSSSITYIFLSWLYKSEVDIRVAFIKILHPVVLFNLIQFYIDPASGYKFRSKVDALRYLETGDIMICKCNLDSMSGKLDNKSLALTLKKVAFERVTDEKFPSGWVKDIRVRKTGDKQEDQVNVYWFHIEFYIDPVSGYKFRSKVDALHYLETGDIMICKCNLNSMSGKLDNKSLALTLKKEFDTLYGPDWHCIVGTSFGSYVTHSVGGFIYFSIDMVHVLLFRTAVEPMDH